MDINKPRASLYIIWEGFHCHTSVSSAGTLSSCVYMISNIWMKTEKIINLDWKQNRSTNLTALALGILNAELIPAPQEWNNGAQEGPLKWPKGKGSFYGKADFKKKKKKKRSSIMQTGDGKKWNQGPWRTWRIQILKTQTAWNQELWSLKAMILVQLENPINPSYQEKGCPRI